MKNKIIISGLLLTINYFAQAQGIHFSQYFNAPALLNPAYTAMLEDQDYRAGINYRNQYQNIPVPFNTVSAFTDFGIGRGEDNNNWWGVGAAFWNDKAGDAQLSMNKAQINAAYHVVPGERSMISFGTALAYTQRNIDLSKLTFLSQWDEFSFNNDLPTKENIVRGSTNYLDVQAGLSYAYFDNNKLYWRIGASVRNINQPTETFIGTKNRLGLRPQIDATLSYKANENFMITPSAYYTSQKSASEILVGVMTKSNMNRGIGYRSELLLGAYHRLGDAVIIATGYQHKSVQMMFSYDHTISSLSRANSGIGAFELSVIYTGAYGVYGTPRRNLGCPRF
jgi:type IX secretion system PorP/SprF family membrane protein